MTGYFWAGLLTGLLIWAAAEMLLLIRPPVSSRIREEVFTVVRPVGPVKDLEYCLRRIQSDLSGCGFRKSRILLESDFLEDDDRQIAGKIQGVQLCTKAELTALLSDV